MTTSIFGNLEIDCGRGVIYFHSSPLALNAGFTATPLRIYGLGEIQYPLNDRQIDITIHPRKGTPDGLLVKVSK